MSTLSKQRSYDSFFSQRLNKSKEGTRQAYHYALGDFDKFCKMQFKKSLEQMLDEFKVAESDDIIDTLQEFMNQSTIEPHNLRVRMSLLNTYLYYRKVKIDPRDLKQLKYEEGEAEERRAVSLDDLRRICDQARPKRKALYITMVSTGMPIGEAVQIRKSDLDYSESRIKIHIKKSYTKKNSRPRTVYLTKEAEKMVKPILDKIDDDALIFGHIDDVEKATATQMQSFRRVVDELKLGGKYDSGTRTITLHSLRAYFFTKATEKHGIAYAHKMTGHKGYLEQYNRYPEEKKLELFLQLEPELFVYSKKPDSDEIRDMKQEIEQLQKYNAGSSKYFDGLKDEFEEALEKVKRLVKESKK